MALLLSPVPLALMVSSLFVTFTVPVATPEFELTSKSLAITVSSLSPKFAYTDGVFEHPHGSAKPTST